MLIEEYKTSLKNPEVEEMFDLIFFRPVAYLVVKAIQGTGVTPNHVTAFSVVVGIISAAVFSQGTSAALMWAAILYAIANILDCADGQLARLQHSGTLFGRVWDGVADYVSSIAVFIGIGFALPLEMVWMVIAAGLSGGFHAAAFDHYQSAFMAMVNGNGNFLQQELERFTHEINRMWESIPSGKERGEAGWRGFLLQIYLWYVRAQILLSKKQSASALVSISTTIAHERMIRCWSFLGPTTNRTVLIVCALFGRLDLYLYAVVIGGNLWLLACVLLQRRLNQLSFRSNA